MRRPFFILLVVLVIIILMAAEIFIIKSASDFEPKVEAVYAKTPISAGAAITAEMVQVKSVAVSAAHRNARPAVHTVVTVPVRPSLYRGVVLGLMGQDYVELKVHVDTDLPADK